MNWHYDGEIQIRKLATKPFDTNCYVVACPRSGEAVIIDTPAESAKILAQAKGLRITHILITHTHLDHLGAFDDVRDRLKAPVAIHPSEANALSSPPDLTLEDGDVVAFGTVQLRVLHTPGSICLLSGKHLFPGDTLFPGGPGKTGNPAAFEQILSSITDKLFVLPDETLVYPGHGDDTVIGKEKQAYAMFSGRPRQPGLCGDVLWLSS
ncbi:MAG: MBL fold metallo-hydrolase [Chloroflexota bacterium]|nr:MBL fold metallo-hydrolase [Chloroflexota bacterium]